MSVAAEIRAQIEREIAIQRRAGEIAKMQAAGEAMSANNDGLAVLCDAIRIYERDYNESFNLADLAIRRLDEIKAAGRQRKCGWCVLAVGDALAMPYENDQACQAHVHGCEHNPLVMRCKALTSALAEACDLAEEANGDPSSCSYVVPLGERVIELRKVGAA